MKMPSEGRTLAFVALGSNVGARIQHLAVGVNALRDLAADGVVNASPVYETDPVGYLNQGPFLNMVASLYVELTPHQLLEKLLAIEALTGRMRTIQNGPRTLDMDLLLYGAERITDDALVIPHPRMHSRAFVLCPLADIAPHLVLDGGVSVLQLTKELGCEGGISYVGRFW